MMSAQHGLTASVAVDTAENEATLAYGALPIRQYVIQDGKVSYRGGMGPVFYRNYEIRDWLHSWRHKETCVWVNGALRGAEMPRVLVAVNHLSLKH